MTNVLLSILVFLIGVGIVIFKYVVAVNEKSDEEDMNKMTFDKGFDIIKTEIANREINLEYNKLSGEDFTASYRRQAKTSMALKMCIYGDEKYVVVVRGIMKGILNTFRTTEEELLELVNLKSPKLSPEIKMEIILYFYKIKHGKDALAILIKEYNLDRTRISEAGDLEPYRIDREDVDLIYSEKNYTLNFNTMMDIIVLLYYQNFKGFGKIDTYRSMNSNGINIGVSGATMGYDIKRCDDGLLDYTRSVWLHFEGKHIHLRYISFDSENDLRRVVLLLGRYGNRPPLTEKLGSKVSTMYDKSRLLTTRPPMSESWAGIVRKFSLPNVELNFLLNRIDRNTGKSIIFNFWFAAELLKYLMRTQTTTLVTGVQYSGKTTLIQGLIKYIPPTSNLRILEMTFELYLRELYPHLNILSVQETEYITAQYLQDMLKKSDGHITIIGEIATDPVASRFIQGTQISSPFSIGSHHAITPSGLVHGLSNSHASTLNLPIKVAMQQVIDAVPNNLHLNRNETIGRYIDHITEITHSNKSIPYPEIDKSSILSSISSMAEVYREHVIRQSNLEEFSTNTIFRFDKEDNVYLPVNWYSENLTRKMLDKISVRDRDGFLRFVDEYWGKDKYKTISGWK